MKRILLVLPLLVTVGCSEMNPNTPSTTTNVLKSAPSSTTLTPRSDGEIEEWVPFGNGLRWPSSPNGDRTGTAHCRDCNVNPEPYYLSIPDGQYVGTGQVVRPDIHGDMEGNMTTGCHVTYRYTNDDESLTYDERDLALPVIALERRGFYHVVCWRQDGAATPALEGYAY